MTTTTNDEDEQLVRGIFDPLYDTSRVVSFALTPPFVSLSCAQKRVAWVPLPITLQGPLLTFDF
jgi:hypothetical protein